MQGPLFSDALLAALAIDHGELLVAAPRDGAVDGVAQLIGAASGRWSVTATFTSDATGDGFGQAVALAGRRALVGTASAVAVFERSAGEWRPQREVRDTTGRGFGTALGLGSSTSIVGLPLASGGGIESFDIDLAAIARRPAPVASDPVELQRVDDAVPSPQPSARAAFARAVPTPGEVARYENWQRRRISIKPGITGLWQVSGRSAIDDFDEIVRMDLSYIDNWSLWLDLKILLMTIPVVLGGRGAF